MSEKQKIKEEAPTNAMGGGTSISGTGPIAFAEPLIDINKKKKPLKRFKDIVKNGRRK